MLTESQAHRIADELLQQARAVRFGLTDPAGGPVSPMYDCRDLRSLPAGLQLVVVRRATQEIGTGRTFLLFMLAWILTLVTVWMCAPTLHGKPFFSPPLIIVAWVVPLALRTVLVRRAVRLIAACMKAGGARPSR